MAYRFDDALDSDVVKAISKKFNFGDKSFVELFMMDFLMTHRLYSKMPMMILRGGMCVPFYIDQKVRRLSIDVDLFTHLSVAEVDKIMDALDAHFSDISIKKRTSKDIPIPNFAGYRVTYNSNFDAGELNIDCMCGVDIDIPYKSISGKTDIMGFFIDYPLKILTRGALISDKITTLGLDTIGLNSRGSTYPGDLPKQIYDIATLLKYSTDNDIKELFDVCDHIIEFKSRIHDKQKYNVPDIFASIEKTIKGLLISRHQLTIRSEYDNGVFGNFIGSYLGKQRYDLTDHLFDVLLVWLFTKFLRRSILNVGQKDKITNHALSKLKTYMDFHNVQEKTLASDADLEDMPELPFSKKHLKYRPVELAFLIREIFRDDY